MAGLSITKAWNESATFLKLHFGALFTIALAFVALPNIAMQALGPTPGTPGQPPEPGLWLLLVPLVLVLNVAASLAMSSLALGRMNVVGEAIGHGFRRCLPMLGAIAILMVALLVVLLPLMKLSGLTPDDFARPAPAKAGRLLLVMLLILAVGLFVAVRLLLMTPVAASERAGPLAIIRRSWALTAGHFWKLLGFLGLMIIVLVVVTMVITLILGLLIAAVAGPPQPGTTGGFVLALVGSLVNAAFVVVTTTLIARIYVQLSGGAAGGSGAAAAGPTSGI
jgi:hypothetical protein